MIIAICGQWGTGKSTAAKYIETVYGFNVYTMAQPFVRDSQKNYVISDVQSQHELDELKRLDDVVSITLFREPYEPEVLSLRTDLAIGNDASHKELYGKLDEVMWRVNTTQRI